MEFIKKNPALAIGVGLPCLVVILFFFATLIPAWVVDAPQYDALFATQQNCCTTNPDNSEMKFNISDGHLKAYRRKWPKQGYEVSDTQLFLFDSKTMRLHEISFPPYSGSSDDWQEFPVPEVQSVKLDPSTTAPDGYQFHDRYNYNGDMWPLFGGGYNHETISLGKNGREVKLALPNAGFPNYNGNLHFLGWVIERERK